MKGNRIWTLVLGVLMATMALGTAAASHDEESFDDSFEGFEDDTGMFASCTSDNGNALGVVTDMDTHREFSEERDQEVDIEEDDVLLGIALANNGGDDIDFNSLRDITVEDTTTQIVAADTDLDREDVFSALALGLDSEADSLGALECVANVDAAVQKTTRATQDVDLDEDTVLLAIALENSVGGSDLSVDNVADINTDVEVIEDLSQDVDIDRQDTFLALALGAGGNGGGSGGGMDDHLGESDAFEDHGEDVLDALN